MCLSLNLCDHLCPPPCAKLVKSREAKQILRIYCTVSMHRIGLRWTAATIRHKPLFLLDPHTPKTPAPEADAYGGQLQQYDISPLLTRHPHPNILRRIYQTPAPHILRPLECGSLVINRLTVDSYIITG